MAPKLVTLSVPTWGPNFHIGPKKTERRKGGREGERERGREREKEDTAPLRGSAEPTS